VAYCYTHGVAWSVGLSVCNGCEPCKNTSGGPRELCVRRGQDLPREGALLRGMTSGFSRTPPRAPFPVAPTSAFPRTRTWSISVPTSRPQNQSSIILNFPNENPPRCGLSSKFFARLSLFIDREFVTSAKKFANFNEFSEIKKIVKIRTKIR